MYGRFIRRFYAIGDAPVLDVHADCNAMIDALGLYASGAIRAFPDAMELFLLGREYPRKIRVFPADHDFAGKSFREKGLYSIDYHGKEIGRAHV